VTHGGPPKARSRRHRRKKKTSSTGQLGCKGGGGGHQKGGGPITSKRTKKGGGGAIWSEKAPHQGQKMLRARRGCGYVGHQKNHARKKTEKTNIECTVSTRLTGKKRRTILFLKRRGSNLTAKRGNQKRLSSRQKSLNTIPRTCLIGCPPQQGLATSAGERGEKKKIEMLNGMSERCFAEYDGRRNRTSDDN